MSDSSKPQQQRSGATPIKNPLLSASVTGLTFDDFPNKPQLLPAAPPIVHAPVPPPSVTPSALLGRGKWRCFRYYVPIFIVLLFFF